MGFKQKFKGLWNKLRRKRSAPTETATGKDPTDSELSADEVVEREVFPPPKTAQKSKAVDKACDKADAENAACKNPSCSAKGACAKTKSSSGKKTPIGGKGKRNGTRPTNPDYEMIDKSDDTVDASKT